MALIKKALGPQILSFEKGNVEEVKSFTLDKFAIIPETEKNDMMVAFSVKENKKYYWASTKLSEFLLDNQENAEYDNDTMTYSFPEDTVKITHTGKTQLKSDPTKSCNTWLIEC